MNVYLKFLYNKAYIYIHSIYFMYLDTVKLSALNQPIESYFKLDTNTSKSNFRLKQKMIISIRLEKTFLSSFQELIGGSIHDFSLFPKI